MQRTKVGPLTPWLGVIAIAVAACGKPSSSTSSPHSALLERPASSATDPARTHHVTRMIHGPEEGAALEVRRDELRARRNVFGGSAPAFDYYGGDVISNVNVVAVDWTGGVDSALSTKLPGFFSTITATGSPYFSWLSEYATVGLDGVDGLPGSDQTLGFGTFASTVVITPTFNTTKSLSDSDISTELNAQIAAGNLPVPVTDGATPNPHANTLYMVDFPPGYAISAFGGTSCKDFCGYHNSFLYGAQQIPVPYAVLPDMSPSGPCASGCGKSADWTDNSTSVHAHELVEAMTDTEAGGFIERPAAWLDPMNGDEVADICNGIQAQVLGYTVQEIWSNANGDCIAVAPLCTGVSSPPSCTPCTATDGGVGCSGTKPACETDSTNLKSGQCVACATDADCDGSTPICNKSSDTKDDTCRACEPGDCAAPKGLCSTSGGSAGRCVQCDTSNASGCTGSTPHCDEITYTCVECLENKDCSGETPVCDRVSFTCRACATDLDCTPERCVTDTSAPNAGLCVQCLSNSDCGAGTCNLSTNTCQCSSDSECNNPTPVCGPSMTCVGCTKSSDCTKNPSGEVCASGSCVQCGRDADCKEPTPICDPATNTCMEATAPDAGAGDVVTPPPADAGHHAHKDAGAGEGGATPPPSSGGCATSPWSSSTPSLSLALLVGGGLFARRRRRR